MCLHVMFILSNMRIFNFRKVIKKNAAKMQVIFPRRYSLVFLCLRCREHAILHQSPLKRSMHSLQTIRIADAFQVFCRFEDPPNGVINSDPN